MCVDHALEAELVRYGPLKPKEDRNAERAVGIGNAVWCGFFPTHETPVGRSKGGGLRRGCLGRVWMGSKVLTTVLGAPPRNPHNFVLPPLLLRPCTPHYNIQAWHCLPELPRDQSRGGVAKPSISLDM